jgi:thiol-disulfide isomerase/thioredoxin
MRFDLATVSVIVGAIALGFTAKSYFDQPGMAAGALPGGPASLAGAPAASYAVTALDGRPDALEHYRGHVVLLNLWASWCAPCRSETPALERLYETERARGLVVIGVDQGDSAEAARAFVRELKLNYPIWLDDEQRYGRAYAAVGLPTSLVIAPDGHIVRGVDGELTLAQMHELVDPLVRH